MFMLPEYGLILCVAIFMLVKIFAFPQCGFLHNVPFRRFHKIKVCHRSDLPVIARANFDTAEGCMNFAKERRGLAINFSPPGAIISEEFSSYYFTNCQVLGCPETVNSSTFVNDSTFDYYSTFGDLEALDNSTCIKSIGLFRVFQDKSNYSTAISNCNEVGGDLAHIVSEIRTNGLATLIANEISEWFKAAYVGLDDLSKEGHFETALGESLSCFTYRAWAPGQPRNRNHREDCVILDADKSWKVINCKKTLQYVCELFPKDPPPEIPKNVTHVSCSAIRNKRKRKKCRKARRKRKHKPARNVTVAERCLVDNDE